MSTLRDLFLAKPVAVGSASWFRDEKERVNLVSTMSGSLQRLEWNALYAWIMIMIAFLMMSNSPTEIFAGLNRSFRLDMGTGSPRDESSNEAMTMILTRILDTINVKR